MNLEIICASRTATGKINLRKLRREAIKTRINPSLEIGRCDNVSLSKEGRGASEKISLSINYSPPVNAVKAYEDLHNYKVLSRDIGNLKWATPTAKVGNLNDEFFKKGTWYLTEEDETYKKQLLEGKVIFSIGINGVSLAEAQELSSDFDYIKKCKGYEEIGIREDLPMIFNPVVYFDTILDSLDIEKMKTKLSLLEKLKSFCWGVGEFSSELKEKINLSVDADLFSFEKISPSFYVGNISLMQGDAASKKVIAEYVFEKKPAG